MTSTHRFHSIGAVAGLAVVLLALAGCSRDARHESATRSASAISLPLASPACPNGPILGFEQISDWDVAGADLLSSTVTSEGAFSLAVRPFGGHAAITSAALTSSDPELAALDAGNSFELDLLLPPTRADAGSSDPSDAGDPANRRDTLAMSLSSPSRGLHKESLGLVNLTALARGAFQTVAFAIPADVATALHGQTYSDLQITFVLAVHPSPDKDALYLFDDLRLRSPDGSAFNVHPQLLCVVPADAGQAQALFGYRNENAATTTIPVGPNNQMVAAPVGRGQLEDFLPLAVSGAFAVAFDGTPLAWTLPGGCASASAASPICPNTPCAAACRHGEQCVAGRCVTSCGDGLCAGDESCDTCPVDCACAPGRVCLHNMCATPMRCGVEWQCGSGTAFGVPVDCGACPDAGTCSNHVCQ